MRRVRITRSRDIGARRDFRRASRRPGRNWSARDGGAERCTRQEPFLKLSRVVHRLPDFVETGGRTRVKDGISGSRLSRRINRHLVEDYRA
jgi:hypothetical protein